MLDVQQIFGRAGRPQFDKVGFGTILTSHDKLGHYLSLLTRQLPIESQFKDSLVDNLNAEVNFLLHDLIIYAVSRGFIFRFVWAPFPTWTKLSNG